MRLLSLAIVAALAYVVQSQTQGADTTVVVYVTVRPSSTPAPVAIIPQAETTEHKQQDGKSTLLSSNSIIASTSPSAPSSPSHLVQEINSSQALPEVTTATSTASTYYEPGPSSPGTIDTDGGASGSDAAAFRLSKGGLAAILIVVILVSLFGSK
jgi:hypothetical protein